MIAALTGIRAVAASWVVVDHLQDPLFGLFPGLSFLDSPVQNGYLGVEIFFVLSGFIMAHNYAMTMETGSAYRSFVWARVARIYPVHLTTLIMVLFLAMYSPSDYRFAVGPDFPNTVGNFVGNVFMLQAVPGFRGFIAPSWSITCEFAAYLIIFPPLAWCARRLRPGTAGLAAVAVLLGGVVALNATAVTNPWQMSYSVLWIRIAVEFTAGVLIWTWWREKPRVSTRWDVGIAGSIIGTAVACFAIDPESRLTFIVLPLLALFVVSCASATGPLGRLLSSRLMQWGGKVSYSLYLGHCVAYLLMEEIAPWERYVDAPLPLRLGWFVVVLAWIVGSAACLYYLVEAPGRRLILSWRGRAQSGVAATSDSEQRV